MSESVNCELCGEPMPPGETMFKFHGYSGPCPKPPIGNPMIRELAQRFSYHAPSSDLVANSHNLVRAQLESAATLICDLVPEGRERATVLTKLEEAMFWANAGIARNQEKSAELAGKFSSK